MRQWSKACRWGLVVAFVAGFAVGCESSSRRTVRTYEYDDRPDSMKAEEKEPDSVYEMQSEGEMVSPGEMVVD